MPYVLWLVFWAAITLSDHLGIAESLHKYLVTLLLGVVGLIGFVLMVSAYTFLIEKLGGKDSGWQSGLAFGLVLGPYLVTRLIT